MEQNLNLKANAAYTYVDNPESLSALTQALKGVTTRIGFDTEADSLHHYFEKVCLIQLSFLGKSYILDPLVNLPLTEFFEVLAQKELIIQGADYDIRMLQKSFGFQPKAPVFDTMLAAQVLGYGKIGLAALAEKICSVILPKTGQKSDWSKRPLTESLLKYASDDTRYLETIANVMTEELKKLNRLDWHRESCEKAVKNALLPGKNEEKEAWRIKGSSKADQATLVFVRELWKWRDEEARQRDRPPFMIMMNEEIMKISEWRVQNRHSPLSQGPSFLKRFSGEKLERLKNTIQAAGSIPQSQWPEFAKKRDWSEERPDSAKLDSLSMKCKAIAANLKMESSVMASRAALNAVILYQAESVEKIMEVSGLMRWQAELVMSAIKG